MRNYSILVAMICAGLTAGCGHARTAESLPKGDDNLVARIHFVGSTRIASDPKAAALNEIIALPATAPLLDETIQKLATTPYRMLQKGRSIGTNDYSSVIRPILYDLLHAESYAEMRGPTNHVPELLLAVRLDQHRAEYWQTNLATILTAWTGIPVNKIQAEGFQGWELKKHHNPNCIRFIRAGDWTLFGWGQDDLHLQPAMLQRIKSTGRPAPPLKDTWLDAWMDWPSITPYHPFPFPFELPKMQLTLEGKKEFIRPELTMQFPQPLELSLKPWQIPTSIIHNPICSFTAVRGLAPWLNHFPQIRALNADSLPDQGYIWAMAKTPFETFAAVPVQNATNYLKKIEPGLVSMINSNLQLHHLAGSAKWSTTNNVIVARGFPLLSPYIRPIRTSEGDYLLAGVMPQAPGKEPIPPALVHEVMSRSNLVCYDWEITAQRLAEWRPLSQLYLIASRSPFPSTNSPAQKWLLTTEPKLGNCGTVITAIAPNELTLVRNSTIGLSSVELTWLTLWLESPGFPLDFHYESPAPRPRAQIAPRRTIAPPPH